jgi:putative membrane protein
MRDMVKDHKKDVGEFKRESTMAKDSDVKKFAAQTLPTLEDHLKQAESIAPATGAASAH